ncbi:MAG: hypothetical protein HY341_00845 [Candidatus Kerfeldbacteria bacterium]|nr:hypothetical protein [Candidatus Kerfeldbacteria bacterium]
MTRITTTVLIVAVLALGIFIAVVFLGNPGEESCGSAENPCLSSVPTAPHDAYRWSTSEQGPYGDRVSYATSSDLVVWKDSGVILADHASVPGAVVHDGTIYLYFVDVTTDGVPERLGIRTSADDGVTWSAKRFVTIEGVGNRVPVDPAPILLDDGRIRLYYVDIAPLRRPLDGVTLTDVYSAVSDDGVTFTQEPGERYNHIAGFDPDVVKVGDTWRMYVGDPSANTVFSATSADGLTFTPEASTEFGEAYVGGSVPDVWYEDGTYTMFVAGIDVAASGDGITFVKTPYAFHSSLGGVTADPSVAQLSDGSYVLFYKNTLMQ